MSGLIYPVHRWFYAILLGLCPFFFFFYGLGSFGLLNNNEGLYGEIAREMLGASFKDWIIPRLNGVSYIEKPPLLYWLTAFSFKIFGISEWSARLPPAFSGLITTLALMYFLYKLQIQRLIFSATLMLSSCLGYVIFSRMLFFEGLLTAFVSLSLLSFYLWWEKDKLSWIRLSYFFVGCASLTKGLVAPLILLGCVSVFFVVERPSWDKIKRFLDPLGLGIFLLVFMPWPILAQWYEPNFFSFYFINEHILRFLDLREPRDYYRGPFYYYLPRILGYVFPWTPFLGLLCVRAKEKDPSLLSLKRFLTIWIMVPLIFYSVSRAKANYYMIIAIIPFVLLVSIKIQQLISEKREIFLIGASVISACLALGIFLGPLFFETYLSFSILFLGIFMLGTLFFFWGVRLKKTRMNWLFVYGAFISGMVLLFILKDAQILEKDPRMTLKNITQNLKNKKIKDIYFYKNFEEMSSFVFYLKHPVVLVDSVSADLFYASQQPQFQRRFVRSEDLILNRHDYVIVHGKSKESFDHSPLQNKTSQIYDGGGIFIYQGNGS